MHVYFKLLTGKTVTLEVEESETIVSLKNKIELQEGIPYLNQTLSYSGNILEDGYNLKDYFILHVLN